MREVDEFFEANYAALARYCRAKWNGSGADVVHEAYVIARKRYSVINFSLFTLIAKESARNLKIHRTEIPMENIHTPPQLQPQHEDPRMEKLMEVLKDTGMDAEDVLRSSKAIAKIRAEIQGQLSLHIYTGGDDCGK